MKSYINNYVLIMLMALSLAINFTSCSDDNFVDEEEEMEEITPDTLPYIFATGIISDSDGNPISNVTVDYLVDGETKNVTTNDLGAYEIRQLDINSERTAIRCHSEGFIPKVDILLSSEDRTIEKNIILARDMELDSGPSDNLTDLALTGSIISVSGRLINEDGEGIHGIPIYAIDYNLSTFLYGITDQNGNWSIAMAPQENIAILVFNPCQGLEIIFEEISLLEDTDLGEFTSSQIEPIQLTFSGFITDCNTQEGLILGDIEFSFQNNPDVYTADIVNGQYDIQIPQCAPADCIDVRVISYISQSGVDDFECQEFTTSENNLDFEVCNTANPTSNGGYLSVILDGQTSEYELVAAQEESQRYLISAQNVAENSGVIFITETLADSGTFDIAGIIGLSDQVPLYNVGNGAIDYQIDSTTTEFLYGSYNGTIINVSNGQNETIEGVFKAKLQ